MCLLNVPALFQAFLGTPFQKKKKKTSTALGLTCHFHLTCWINSTPEGASLPHVAITTRACIIQKQKRLKSCGQIPKELTESLYLWFFLSRVWKLLRQQWLFNKVVLFSSIYILHQSLSIRLVLYKLSQHSKRASPLIRHLEPNLPPTMSSMTTSENCSYWRNQLKTNPEGQSKSRQQRNITMW